MPAAPAKRMDAIAAYLRVRAAASSRHGSDSPESQLVVNDSVYVCWGNINSYLGFNLQLRLQFYLSR